MVVRNGRLYEVSIQPIESGPRTASRNLGFLVLGYEVDDALWENLSRSGGKPSRVFVTATKLSEAPYRRCRKPN